MCKKMNVIYIMFKYKYFKLIIKNKIVFEKIIITDAVLMLNKKT